MAAEIQGQGVLSGCVVNAETRAPIPFASVIVLNDGRQICETRTDLDGCYRVEPINVDTCEVRVYFVGYSRAQKDSVRMQHTGVTMLNFELTPVGMTLDNVDDSIDGEETAHCPLPEYRIVNRGLKRLLDRVIEGKENTYFWAMYPVQPHPRPRGTSFNLYLITSYPIDTADYETDYLNILYRDDTTLPRPLIGRAPIFSFDSVNICVSITTTPNPLSFTEAYGFVEYRGRVFFLCHPIIESTFLCPRKGHHRLFKQKNLPPWFRRDPPTWIYTYQQGHWYRWMEYPNGF